MRFFLAYLKQRKGLIGVLALFCLIFLAAFWLYSLPLGAVLYPAAVCLVLGILFLFFDVRRTAKKHQLLEKLTSLPSALMETLPEERTQDDRDYQALIRLLREEQAQLENTMSRRYADMIDYYTVWAHQIKTPIASMRLTLQNEDSALSRQLSEDLFRIEQYVEMVLMFLRLDADSTDYVIREYELDAIVRQAVRKYSTQFIHKKVKLHYEPVNTRVITDEKWLLFVVEQVLSNAVKYTPRGSVTIRLEEPQTLVIEDTGLGIAPEDLPRGFEKGYTGQRGRADQRSTGIGLYLCRRTLRQLGHTISIHSTPKEGTAVRIHLQRQSLPME